MTQSRSKDRRSRRCDDDLPRSNWRQNDVFSNQLFFHKLPFKLRMWRYDSDYQWDQIWRNLSALAKFYKSMANFWLFFSNLTKCWGYFGKFMTLFGKLSLLLIAKCARNVWKILVQILKKFLLPGAAILLDTLTHPCRWLVLNLNKKGSFCSKKWWQKMQISTA